MIKPRMRMTLQSSRGQSIRLKLSKKTATKVENIRPSSQILNQVQIDRLAFRPKDLDRRPVKERTRELLRIRALWIGLDGKNMRRR